jgi:hypothetical protein
MPTPESRLCYHEAGHAIAYIHYGITLHSVSVSIEDGKGLTLPVQGSTLPRAHYKIVICAGLAADVIHAGGSDTEGSAQFSSRRDFELYWDLFGPDGIENAINDAAGLLRDRWGQVESLAEELIRVNSIDSKGISILLDTVT